MIAHVDADAFFASVLQRKDPALKGKPILALGMGGGCVIAASYEAKSCGVKTGMTLRDARKLVPHALELKSDFHEACVVSTQLQSFLENECAFVERMSVDEWFADLNTRQGGLPSHPKQWAELMQDRMRAATDVTVSVGIAPSKILAKMAGEYRKPAGVTMLYENDIEGFLKDRPAAAIPGIGPKRSLFADAQRWTTAWDVAMADKETIRQLCGRPGLELQEELLGHCLCPVSPEKAPPKSVSRCRSFRADSDRDRLIGHTLEHLTRTILKMRGHGLACNRVALWLRDSEYRYRGTNCRLPRPMETEEELLPYVKKCFSSLWRGDAITQAGLGLLELCPTGATQYSLFADPRKTDKAEQMQTALDSVHDRYGRDSLIRATAVSLGRRQHESALPDLYGRILECR